MNDPFEFSQKPQPMGFFKLVVAIALGSLLSQVALVGIVFGAYFYHYKTDVEPRLAAEKEALENRMQSPVMKSLREELDRH